jgi:hypothetical protein
MARLREGLLSLRSRVVRPCALMQWCCRVKGQLSAALLESYRYETASHVEKPRSVSREAAIRYLEMMSNRSVVSQSYLRTIHQRRLNRFDCYCEQRLISDQRSCQSSCKNSTEE